MYAAILPKRLASQRFAPAASAKDDVISTLSPAPETSIACGFRNQASRYEVSDFAFLPAGKSFPQNQALTK